MNKRLHSFIILVVSLALHQLTFAQGTIVGTFPAFDGGFENQNTVGSNGSTTLGTGIQLPNWTAAAALNGTNINSSGAARTGTKCISWTTSSTSNVLWSPTEASTNVGSATSYVVQFWWWKGYSGSARVFDIAVTPDGTAKLGSLVSSPTNGTSAVSSSWSMQTVVVTSGNSAATPRYGFVQFKPKGGSFGTSPGYYLDDIVVYPGNAADATAPGPATGATATVGTDTSLNLSWTAPGTGVDGGGYVVVRNTAATAVTLNQNGIYSIGNAPASGGGTVVYIGSNTSFTDTALVTGTPYYYSIFTVDKAFNYAPAATISGTPVAPVPVTLTSIRGYQKNNGIQLEWVVSQELAVEKYSIEKSGNGRDFSARGTVNAIGSTAFSSAYNYFDAQPGNGANLYRLNVINKNGSHSYSQTVKVVIGQGAPIVSVYPNPLVNNLVNIQLSNFEKDRYGIILTDRLGQVVYATVVDHPGGSSTQSVNLPALSPGVYQLSIAGKTVTILKQ